MSEQDNLLNEEAQITSMPIDLMLWRKAAEIKRKKKTQMMNFTGLGSSLS